MITVNYKLISSPFLGGEALILAKISGSCADVAYFRFDGIKSGIFHIGDRAYTISDSTCSVNLSEVQKDVLTPIAELGKRRIPATPIIKSDYGLNPAPADAEAHGRLLSLCLSLEERMSKCESEIKEILSSVNGHPLFNFLEKKKG